MIRSSARAADQPPDPCEDPRSRADAYYSLWKPMGSIIGEASLQRGRRAEVLGLAPLVGKLELTIVHASSITGDVSCVVCRSNLPAPCAGRCGTLGEQLCSVS